MEVSIPETHKSAYRHPKYKTSYRVKNWPEYETSLRNRGDITVWLSRDAVDAWTPPKNGKRGGQPLYSDLAIETFILRRSESREGQSGNVSLDTICRVTRKTLSIVTRKSLGDG